MCSHRIGALVAAACLAMVSTVTAWAEPTIEITEVPPYGVNGFVRGTVSGVDVSTHRVATYIQIEGSGWWTKPTFASPTGQISPDGSFIVDVATGGIDNRATIYCVGIVPEGVIPPQAAGAPRIPAGFNSLAIDHRERYGRTLEFAGYTWAVKESPLPVGPGGNYFSDSPSDVWVDNDGLHLTINNHDGYWWSAEVILLDRLGYGTYAFQTNSRTDTLDANATFGAFTWDSYGDDNASGRSHHREIDFEDSRWGNAADPTNAQFVVQPWDEPGSLRRYSIPDLSGDPALTRFFTWEPGQIEFVSLLGHHSPADYPPEDLIDRWVYTHDPASNHFVPAPGRATFRFNLWLNQAALSDGLPIEVVISDFNFTPVPEPSTCVLMAVGLFSLLVYGAIRVTAAKQIRRTPDV